MDPIQCIANVIIYYRHVIYLHYRFFKITKGVLPLIDRLKYNLFSYRWSSFKEIYKLSNDPEMAKNPNIHSILDDYAENSKYWMSYYIKRDQSISNIDQYRVIMNLYNYSNLSYSELLDSLNQYLELSKNSSVSQYYYNHILKVVQKNYTYLIKVRSKFYSEEGD